MGKLFHPDDPKNFDPVSWTDNVYGGYFGQDHCPKEVKTNGSHGCAVPASLNHTFPDVETLNAAKGFLEHAAADPSKPFWIGVGFVKPHMPHVFPAKYLSEVPARGDILLAKHQEPATGIAAQLDWESGAGANGPTKGNLANISAPAPIEVQQDWKQNYYAAAAFSDDMMGELLTTLKTLGLSDNTLIVMTADHGWGLGEHNHWVKYTNWETDARVPLIVHHPKAPHTWGMHTKSLVEHVDLYPTFAELAGIAVTADAHESIEGSSYASLFATGAKPSKMVWTNTHNASFTQYPRCGETINADGSPGFQAPIRCASVSKEKFVFMGYSMRTTRWRYTEWAPWNGAKLKPEWCADPTVKNALVELYDHEGDSLAAGAVGQKTWDDFENVNVASQNEDLVKELSQRLRAFYATNEAQRGAAYGA